MKALNCWPQQRTVACLMSLLWAVVGGAEATPALASTGNSGNAAVAGAQLNHIGSEARVAEKFGARASLPVDPNLVAQASDQSQQPIPSPTPPNHQNPPLAGTPVPPAAPQPSQQPSTTAPAGVAPVGTAVAPDMRPGGAPAATPSGAAIAPAKQRRIRRFGVRTALLVGGVVAIGVVAGASLASPNRPH